MQGNSPPKVEDEEGVEEVSSICREMDDNEGEKIDEIGCCIFYRNSPSYIGWILWKYSKSIPIELAREMRE